MSGRRPRRTPQSSAERLPVAAARRQARRRGTSAHRRRSDAAGLGDLAAGGSVAKSAPSSPSARPNHCAGCGGGAARPRGLAVLVVILRRRRADQGGIGRPRAPQHRLRPARRRASAGTAGPAGPGRSPGRSARPSSRSAARSSWVSMPSAIDDRVDGLGDAVQRAQHLALDGRFRDPAGQDVAQLDEVGPQRHHGLEVRVARADVVDGDAEAHAGVVPQGPPERREVLDRQPLGDLEDDVGRGQVGGLEQVATSLSMNERRRTKSARG